MLVEKRVNKSLRYGVVATVLIAVFMSVTITGLGSYYIFRAQLVPPPAPVVVSPPPITNPAPETVESLITQAKQLLLANQAAEAAPLLDRALKLNSELPEVYRLRAAAAVALNDFDTAINNYQQTVQRDGQDLDSGARLGKLLEQLGRDSEAVAHYTALLEQHPDQHELRLRLATTLLRLNNLDAARKQYEQLANNAPSEIATVARKELKRFASDTTTTAKQTTKVTSRPETTTIASNASPPIVNSPPPREVEPLPPPPKVETPKSTPRPEPTVSSGELIQRGNQLNNGGDLRGALREYEKALKQDPSNADVHYLMGTVYFKLRDFEAARDAYQKCTSGVYANVARSALKNVEKELKKR
jgi:tetratricopeptide (TPR) repeat protein